MSSSKHPSVTLNDASLAAVARRFRLLGEPIRLRILREFMESELSVNEIVDATGAGQATVSKHLGLLRAEQLVDFRREGARKHYFISDPVVPALCRLVCGSLEAQFRADLCRLRDTPVPASTPEEVLA